MFVYVFFLFNVGLIFLKLILFYRSDLSFVVDLWDVFLKFNREGNVVSVVRNYFLDD